MTSEPQPAPSGRPCYFCGSPSITQEQWDEPIYVCGECSVPGAGETIPAAPAEPSVVSDTVPVPTVPAGVEELKRAVVRLTEEVEDLANGLLTATNGYDQAMGRGWMRLVEPVRAALAQLEPAPNQENAG